MQEDDSGESYSYGYETVSASEKTRRVHAHFDSIAGKYDRMNTLLSFGMHHLWKRAAVRMAGVQDGSLILDVCGGTADIAMLASGVRGVITRHSSLVTRHSTTVVYDMNRAMMEIGRNKAAIAGAEGRIMFVEGDAEKLSFCDETFDVAMVAFGIRNLVHPETGFREIHRVLKKGGRLVCLEFSREVSWWFKPLYDFYSFAIMPLLGMLFAGSRKAYTYLPESIRVFSTPGELSDALQTIGFTGITHKKLTQGIAVIHRAIKP